MGIGRHRSGTGTQIPCPGCVADQEISVPKALVIVTAEVVMMAFCQGGIAHVFCPRPLGNGSGRAMNAMMSREPDGGAVFSARGNETEFLLLRTSGSKCQQISNKPPNGVPLLLCSRRRGGGQRAQWRKNGGRWGTTGHSGPREELSHWASPPQKSYTANTPLS